MAFTERAFHCCGWSELHGINEWNGTKADFDAYIKQINVSGHRIPHAKCGSVIFTSNDSAKPNNAHRMAKLLEKYKLGTLTELPSFTNPNTARTITSFVWVLDKKAVTAYVAKLQPPPKPYGAW